MKESILEEWVKVETNSGHRIDAEASGCIDITIGGMINAKQ
jgi:hypothetical protein